MTPVEQLTQQLEALMITLNQIPETDEEGNAAYYLNKLVHLVANQGVDEPMVATFWFDDDFNELLGEEGEPPDEPISRDRARELFALIDRSHDAHIGVNWDVLEAALDSNLAGGASCN